MQDTLVALDAHFPVKQYDIYVLHHTVNYLLANFQHLNAYPNDVDDIVVLC